MRGIGMSIGGYPGVPSLEMERCSIVQNSGVIQSSLSDGVEEVRRRGVGEVCVWRMVDGV